MKTLSEEQKHKLDLRIKAELKIKECTAGDIIAAISDVKSYHIISALERLNWREEITYRARIPDYIKVYSLRNPASVRWSYFDL
ncbi:hypothetical protein [Iningainema tapete]|uniref:Uncharacterized protein n=1 Tax=Iningainema tapete BLCC-T55 TaxID=2748662 RepID=A0A8J6XKG5_9CYAN|nr:hypothetical protein [Iningainema tapete]MBD2772057.1 hypothetical protein [Iningainema tapete BLCC-T55]